MALTLEQKKTVVDEVAAVAAQAYSVVAAEYSGLTVGEFTELRRNARGAKVHVRVVKNTLARKALENTEFACMHDALVGPLVLAFAQEDPGAAARIVGDFAKNHPKLVAKAVALGGQVYPPSELARISKLPNREQALAMLMAVMKAPIEKFVRTLAEPHAKLVRTVAAIRDQKEQAAV